MIEKDASPTEYRGYSSRNVHQGGAFTFFQAIMGCVTRIPITSRARPRKRRSRKHARLSTITFCVETFSHC
jgi:hypothetical protein